MGNLFESRYRKNATSELTQVGLITQIEQRVVLYRQMALGSFGQSGFGIKGGATMLRSTYIFQTRVPRGLQRGVIRQFSGLKAGSGKAT